MNFSLDFHSKFEKHSLADPLFCLNNVSEISYLLCCYFKLSLKELVTEAGWPALDF